MPKKCIFLHFYTPDMTLDYKNRTLACTNCLEEVLFWLYRKTDFLSYFGLSYLLLCYPHCARFLTVISWEPFFSEPQNLSFIENQNQKKVFFSRMGTYFSPRLIACFTCGSFHSTNTWILSQKIINYKSTCYRHVTFPVFTGIPVFWNFLPGKSISEIHV